MSRGRAGSRERDRGEKRWFISGGIAGSVYLPVGLGCLHQVRAAAAAGLRIFLFEKNELIFVLKIANDLSQQ
jgi:hypothetical protein